MPLDLAVLASGEGTIFEALLGEVSSGRVDARFVLVIADRGTAPIVGRAARHRISVATVPSRGTDRDAWASEVDRRLHAAGPELILLDGLRTILPPKFVQGWRGRLLNVHPSLLPAYGGPGWFGARIHEAVLKHGDRETGVTVHEVDESVDHGRVLATRSLRIEPGTTPGSLRERLRPLEVEALVEAISAWTPPSSPT